MLGRRLADLLLFCVTAAELVVLFPLTPTFTIADWIYVLQHLVVLGVALTRPSPSVRDYSIASSTAVIIAYAYPYAQVICLRDVKHARLAVGVHHPPGLRGVGGATRLVGEVADDGLAQARSIGEPSVGAAEIDVRAGGRIGSHTWRLILRHRNHPFPEGWPARRAAQAGTFPPGPGFPRRSPLHSRSGCPAFHRCPGPETSPWRGEQGATAWGYRRAGCVLVRGTGRPAACARRNRD